MFPSVQILQGIYSSAKSRFRFSEFPGPLRGDPKIQIPCFQVCRFQDTSLQIPVSEFPSFRDPQCGSAEGPQIPDSMFPSVQITGYSFANSSFRVSEFPRPLCGSAVATMLLPVSRFRDSMCADSRILLRHFTATSRFQEISACAAHRHQPSSRNMKWAFAHGGTFRQPFTYSSSSTLRAFRVLSTSSLRSACRSGGFLVRAPSVWLLDASVTWVVHFCVVTCCLLFIRTLSRGNRACHGLVCFDTTSIQAYNACGEPVF